MTLTVADLMTRDVVTVTPEAGFRDAVRLIEERGVDALPVVDEDGRVQGVVAESDLLLKEECADGGHGLPGMPWQRARDRARAGATAVRDVMTQRVVTVPPDASPSAAARLMHRHRVGGLPVVGPDRRLLGIVTRSDLLRVFLREDDDLCREVQSALPPDCRDVSCSLQEGVVTLEGQVRLHSAALSAVAAARSVPGVIDVRDRVRFDIDDTMPMTVGP